MNVLNLVLSWYENLPWRNVIVSPVFSLFSLINVILVIVYNSHVLIKDSYLEPLPFTLSCALHIYSHNLSLLRIICQPKKNTAFLVKTFANQDKKVIKNLLQITAAQISPNYWWSGPQKWKRFPSAGSLPKKVGQLG